MQNSSSVCVFCFKPQWYMYIPSAVAISFCKIKLKHLLLQEGFGLLSSPRLRGRGAGWDVIKPIV